MRGWLGNGLWRAARFRGRGDLLTLAAGAGLEDATVIGAVFHPPLGPAAKVMAPIDPWIGRWTTRGAAFLVLSASRPLETRTESELP